MSDHSKIEWTDATWNPIVGCSIVSPGCTNCYAMKMAARIEKMSAHPMAEHVNLQTHYAGTTKKVNGAAVWTGKVASAPDNIFLSPLRRRKPTTYFVNSMGDLFHESIPDELIDRVFAVMALCPHHTFQVLTKRAERMRDYCANNETTGRVLALSSLAMGDAGHFEVVNERDGLAGFQIPNVWLGVSAERQQEADERIPLLLQTPAAVRFVSAEPLLGPVDLANISRPSADGDWVYNDNALTGFRAHKCGGSTGARLDWIIVGGESGPNARPMHPDWARGLRDQCAAAGVPFFFKQWGEYLPVGESLPGYGKVHGATAVKPGRMKLHYGGTPQQAPKHAFSNHGVEFASTADGILTFRVGKKAAGRLLDGREHNDMPTTAAKARAA